MMVSVSLGITAEHIEEVFNHESMSKLSHDHRKLSYIDNPLIKYYSAWNDNDFMGAFMVIRNTEIDYEIHMLLLPKSIRYYRELSTSIIDEVFTYAHRVSTQIMGDLHTIINLVKKLGFQYEGIKREAYYKNGTLKSVHQYGLLKSEWRRK